MQKLMTLLQVTRTVPALSALHPTAHLLRARSTGSPTLSTLSTAAETPGSQVKN